MKPQQPPECIFSAETLASMAASGVREAPRVGSGRPINSPRSLKVVYIGAGISGIVASILFRKAVPSLDLVIYDKNPEIGGTWFENKYD